MMNASGVKAAGTLTQPWLRGTVPRWLVAMTLSAVVVLGATGGVQLAGSAETSLPPLRTWPGCATGAPAGPAHHGRAASETTLVLVDELTGLPISRTYATLAANLASHFGPVKVLDTGKYTAGMLDRYRAVIYLGIADRSPPQAFLNDVHGGLGPVLWLGGNADGLAAAGAFHSRYGWLPGPMVKAKVRGVSYRNTLLSRDPGETEPLRTYTALDPARVSILGTVVAADGSTWPWAVRSANLTYVGELPLNAAAETDRYLAVADLLFDLLAPHTPERHRALVRLEDIGPNSDPRAVRAAGELLSREGVPFSFAVYPVYRGPVSQRPRREIRLKDRPQLVHAITYLLGHGGTMVLHGYSHQTDDTVNPTNGESGEDFEFFRTHWGPQRQLVYDGPVQGDSVTWATRRLDAALTELRAAHLPAPRIMEPPHYAASPTDYRAIARRFAARFDRGQYFSPAWRKRSPASPYMYEQFAPYVIHDVYGSLVVPETLGFVRTTPVQQRAAWVTAIAANARTQRVVRDNVAAFFYHPFLGTELLADAVDRIRARGYKFVSPCEL